MPPQRAPWGANVPRGPRQATNPMSNADKRAQSLQRTFHNIITGKWKITRFPNARDFLESISSQPDKTACLERLASSQAGQESLHRALTFADTQEFMNTVISDFLCFLETPEFKALCDGELLNRIIWAAADPPLFWNNLLRNARADKLTTKALEGFASLLLQLTMLPSVQSHDFRETAKSLVAEGRRFTASSSKFEQLMRQVKSRVASPSTAGDGFVSSDGLGPGGRHDNDFANYRDIATLPTRSELLSTKKPFYLHASSIMEADPLDRAELHLDNQYRLVREDMTGEMKEEFYNVASAKKKRGFKNTFIRKISYEAFDRPTMNKERPCTIIFRCDDDIVGGNIKIEGPNNAENRKKALKRVPNFLRHLSFGCLVDGNNVLGFASIDRNEDQLARNPPRLCLQITGSDSLGQVLLALQRKPLDYLQLSTPVFAYEPILERLQRKTDIEFADDILGLADAPRMASLVSPRVLQSLEQAKTGNADLQSLLGLSKSVSLDISQIQALLHGLTYPVSLIQGPPGTGKSLVGAILAKILVDNTTDTLLVLSFTNHALDQFIEDLIDIGIDMDLIVRLGSKSTTRTAPLLLTAQPDPRVQRRRERYQLIEFQKNHANNLLEKIDEGSTDFFHPKISVSQIFDYLQFSQDDGHFYDALALPEAAEGETIVGPKGKKMEHDYLFTQWKAGKTPGVYSALLLDDKLRDVWSLGTPDRLAKIQEWEDEIRQDSLRDLVTHLDAFNASQKTIQRLKKEKTENILQSKRIIACTTTAASMYASEIQTATPGIVLVEEAGEILESHILAAIGPATKQLIQIGDHKQLRPKVKNYKLTVEAGKGYDLNRSLFERLVLQGRPSCTLLRQHRMRPEISRLIKHNYPALDDAPSTYSHPNLSGFQYDIIFVNHHHPEVRHDVLRDKSDSTMKSSKQNVHEADMVLKCLRYLGQQNYKTDDIVILTPYLGQLFLLMEKLRQENHDPILSDFDSHDLVEAGVLPAASAEVNKRPIRLSTIDNYQGAESDIVIASLTRSNDDGEIGFMCAPERLNVLISRARNALIMIGNAATFTNTAKGGEEWVKLFDNLKEKGWIHDGFPVRCKKHPDRKTILRTPDDFDLHCPDGGCAEQCTELLSCGKHACPKRCHVRIDHSKVPCNKVLRDFCTDGHQLIWQCSDNSIPPCQKCRAEKEEKERKARRDKELELDRQAKQRAYAKQLDAVKEDIERQRQIVKDRREAQLQAQTLRQHEAELECLRKEAQAPLIKSTPPPSQNTSKKKSSRSGDLPKEEDPGKRKDEDGSDQQEDKHDENTGNIATDENDDEPDVLPTDETEVAPVRQESSAEKDWQEQKDLECASNSALDSLMKMIGLETVKKEFLVIKARVDTAVRQGVDLKGDRFGAALLGNPGTGKTTVARLYGQFLSSMGVIPGSHFVETTGSRLAHDGIQGAQALIDEILQKGGGVFFLDEAYQIVSSSSAGGSQVLDFLLAEIENNVGKIVFVFAGYRKQMEAFFAHNPGIPSRIPISLEFQDYEDNELLQIMNFRLDRKFSGRMKVEGGFGGLYMRIASRLIGHGRGKEGFGNAREVENVLDIMLKKQADRLHKARKKGKTPDDLLLQRIDIIGPEPSRAISSNKDWQKLQQMIGLKSVKQSIQVLADRLQDNYERELAEKPLIGCSLNKVFVGNPGTGKTTVAKLYGKILAAMGFLSNGEVVIKNPSDFIGSALGQSEKNTRAILQATKGKVLIIDEAYMLGGGVSDSGGGFSDPYKTSVIDTIVAEVQSTSLEDRCVLLLGYQAQMEDMFQKVNPGLSRRFPMSSAFVFDDYDDTELLSILNLKLKQQGFRASELTKKTCISVLGRARNRPNFGNAGEVDIILDQAKERQQKRLAETTDRKKTDYFEPQDIDPEFNRIEQAATNIRMLFKDVVGCEHVIEKLEGYQQMVQNMRGSDYSDDEIRAQVPFGLLFRGPPGTGKTSTARKMGKVYYDLGLLGEAKVVECSATDIIGQYVGQTGPKVQKKFDEALGRVLFIDEAYRLAEGHFAKEAMDEMVDCLTKERYQNKILVILAGYDNDINRLMNQNPGLTSRFPETIAFYNMPARQCRELLLQCLKMKKLDTTQLENSTTLDGELLDLFGTLTRTKSWANARDVQTLAKSIFGATLNSKKESATRTVVEDTLLKAVKEMLQERSKRGDTSVQSPVQNMMPAPEPQFARSEGQPPSQVSTEFTTETIAEDEEDSEEDDSDDSDSDGPRPSIARRDAGVSDEVWEQLQHDRKVEAQRQRELAAARQKAAELERKQKEEEARLRRERDEAARRAMLLRLEELRVQKDLADRERREKEERARKVAAAQVKLRQMGRCPMNFEWIPQNDGFRCAGGSHFMSNSALDM